MEDTALTVLKAKIDDVWVPVSASTQIPVPVSQGGTGADDAAEARTNLDVFSKGEIQGGVTLSPVKITTLDSPHAVRAWASVLPAGTFSAAMGFASVTKPFVGVYTLTLSAPLPTALPCVTLYGTGSGHAGVAVAEQSSGTTITVRLFTLAAAPIDAIFYIYVVGLP